MTDVSENYLLARGAPEVRTEAVHQLLTWSGALLLGGLILNAAVTMLFHPSGEEDNHAVIFVKYAQSQSWEWVHFGQFVGVLLVLAGLLLLCQALRPQAPKLSALAAGLTVATAAGWAVLQAVDGVALKQTVDAWLAATGPDQAIRFAHAEAIRWTEWGVQSYVRVLFGLTVLLLGAAILVTRFLAAWVGWLALLAGMLSIGVGVDVSYSGLDSGFQQIATPAFQLVTLAFAIGVVVTSRLSRRRDSATSRPTT
jgi:hypothetical protein